MTSKATFQGRAFVYDTGDCTELAIWCNELVPMTDGRRSSEEWITEHFHECYLDRELRELFQLPPTGNYQVLFEGELEAYLSGSPIDIQDWAEDLSLEVKETKPIPDEWLEILLPNPERYGEHHPEPYNETL